MGLMKFVLYFILSLLITIFILDFAPNKFISGFILSLVIAVLAIRGD